MMSESRDFEVGLTSRLMAGLRAVETKRDDRLFDDPFAAKLAGDEAIALAEKRLEEEPDKPFAAVRTRFFDDFLKGRDRTVKQIVILGAGMDTRSFRIDWEPETHIYEIDQEAVLKYKDSILSEVEPRCHRHAIPVDLRRSWSELLLQQGFAPSEPSIWLMEGLLYYLDDETVDRTFKTIQNLTPAGSYLGADFINHKVLQYFPDRLSQYWLSSCDDPEPFLASYGWDASAIQPGDEGASYGRYTFKLCDRAVYDALHIFFVTASKSTRNCPSATP